jgi:hypothetical protein
LQLEEAKGNKLTVGAAQHRMDGDHQPHHDHGYPRPPFVASAGHTDCT